MALNHLIIDSSAQEVERALTNFESSTKLNLHPVVRETLAQTERGSFRVPFLSSHGSYVFGSVYVPTSANDGKPDLVRISCLASHDASLFLVASESQGVPVKNELALTLRKVVESADTAGGSVLGVLELVVNELGAHLDVVQSDLAAASYGIQKAARLSSRRAAAELASCQSKLRTASGELVNVEPIVEAMGHISASIAEDRLDLRVDGKGELFGKNLEIRSQHLADRSRQLTAAARGASRSLAESQVAFDAQTSELRIRGNQLLVALATLFLTPVILLNVYSQFLAEGQSWSNEFTANNFWIVIVAVAVAQAGYFRAKKWLR